MKDEELIPGLTQGGKTRSEALGVIFEHPGIRTAIGYTLRPYREKLEQFFPRTNNQGGDPYGRDNYLDHFFVESLVVLEKKFRDGAFRGNSFAELKSFLTSTARNKCIEWLRKQRPTEEVDPGEGPSVNLEERYTEKDRKDLLLNLLETLGETCRSLLLLVAYGYSNREITVELNLASDSVKSLKSRCRKRLRDLIEGNDDLHNAFGDLI